MQVLVSERSGSGSREQGPVMKRASKTLVQKELCPGQRLSRGGTRQVPRYWNGLLMLRLMRRKGHRVLSGSAARLT